MNFSERYTKSLNNLKFIPLIIIGFLVSLLFLEIRANIYDLIYLQNELNDSTLQRSKFALVFQSIITIFLIIRFILLYFNKPIFGWLSQFFWLLSWLSIFIYHQVSVSYFGCCWSGEHLGSFFEGILSITNRWLFAYMFLSPIKQIAILIFAYFYRK